MKFFALLLTFLLCVVNLKYAACLKCQFHYVLFGYACNLKPDSSSMKEKHEAGKTDDDVEKIQFLGFNKKDFTQSDVSPLCRRFKNATFVWIEELKSVNENLFQQCTNLNKIYIKGLEMQEIPENLFSFRSNLIEINLNFGKLRTLPENVFSKQNKLEELELQKNQISYLPPNIFKSLTKLSYLYLQSNKIQSLNPKWFESLQSLKILWLMNNEIQDLPKNAFANLRNLKELSLHSNQLTTIHSDSFGIHKNLLKIYLRYNKINAIDERILIKTAVKELYMSENVCSDEFIIQGNEIREKLSNCFSNYQPRVEPTNIKCGSRNYVRQAVMGGNKINRKEFPWNVALMSNAGGFFCGGTLVSNRHVVTAAHCMKGKYDSHVFGTGDFSVLLGVYNYSKPQEEGRIRSGVNSINIHEDWNPDVQNFDADIAVLELANEVQFDNFIRPICLANKTSPIAETPKGTVVGFGKTESGTISSVANKLDIPIRKYHNCTNHSKNLRDLVSANTFCGGPSDGRTVCTGDSGGGVYVVHKGQFYLRGLVSATFLNEYNECDTYKEAIFADVTRYYEWIKPLVN